VLLSFVVDIYHGYPVIGYAVMDEKTGEARELGLISFVGVSNNNYVEYIKDVIDCVMERFEKFDAVAIGDAYSEDKYKMYHCLYTAVVQNFYGDKIRVLSLIDESWTDKVEKVDGKFPDMPECIKDAYRLGVYYYRKHYV